MKVTGLNIEIVQNGIILRVDKKSEGDSPEEVKYNNETMVFKDFDGASEWIKNNVNKGVTIHGGIDDDTGIKGKLLSAIGDL